METQIIGVKQLHRDLKEISKMAVLGHSFIVVKNSKPVFRIEPYEEKNKRFGLKDFRKFQFKSKDKKLSREVDKILYTK